MKTREFIAYFFFIFPCLVFSTSILAYIGYPCEKITQSGRMITFAMEYVKWPSWIIFTSIPFSIVLAFLFTWYIPEKIEQSGKNMIVEKR